MKIGIANDRPLAVEALRRALALAPAHEVVWVAQDGAAAVELCARQTPELILMDLMMPVMNGVEATRQIMVRTPCAILIVTVNVGANVFRVFEAMGYGALDAIDTPALAGSDGQNRAGPLLEKIDAIGRLLQDRRLHPAGVSTLREGPPLIAFGASAGGPSALVDILHALPPALPAALVIAQHVDEQFAPGMAEWLNEHSALPVRLAQEGDAPEPGCVLLAGRNDHLVLKTPQQFGYTPEPRDYAYRPSVDALFHSIVKLWAGPAVGVLLTGMGRDGALGLKALRNQGHYTIAQDQDSCTVYGMPKAAAAIRAAVDILPLAQIAPRLAAVLASHRGENPHA